FPIFNVSLSTIIQKSMAVFEVIGGRKLSGSITPQGAKNEALQVIAAVLLTSEPVTIHNIPDIIDINLLIDLLQNLNVKIDRPQRDVCTFTANDIDIEYLKSDSFL